MTNNLKENDILVSTLLNPTANINDLIHAGINSDNTQLLSPDEYKSSDFIKKAFTGDDNKFNEEAFTKAYMMAAKAYSDLNSKTIVDDLKQFIEYNQKDIYAPTNAKFKTPTYNISRVSNPYESITGIDSLFGTAESHKSVRELAQKNKIYDSETGEYLDKSAEDLGLFGGLFSKPLVYAKWHEDGEHIDPITGRTVKHKKGEYRLNDDGKFFTETIGKKQGYDEEFVALSDILTKEDSWLNKIDVFDSDDKEKSAVGVIMKTAMSIAPYFTPFATIWGGITAGVTMASVLPTFAKALEGLAIGDKETGFTNTMSLLENYFKRFDKSMSDEGQKKSFGLESIGHTVADIFGQLYQMRAAASLSKLSRLDWDSANKKAYDNFIKNHGHELQSLIRRGTIEPTKEGIKAFWSDIAAQTPELKALIDKQSKLSRQLSLGYMAMLTSADVYQEALKGGFDRRAAGAAALASTLAQYYMMNSLDDRISSWFLDSVVGYNEHANRQIIREGLAPLWDRIQASVEKLPTLTQEAKQREFATLFSKINNGIQKAYYGLLDGTSELWGRSLAEGIEEISEEAMMDLTKGSFDALAAFGFLGNKNENASFNTIENTFSKEGLIRYAQNAFGGLLGGGLFHLQQNYVEPWIYGEKIPKATKMDLIKGIQNGEAEQYKELARQLASRDKNVSASVQSYNGDIIETTAPDQTQTRGELIADRVIKYIEYLQGVLGQYDADLSQDELISKIIRDKEVLKVLKDSDITNLILDDFDSAITDLADIRERLNSRSEDQAENQQNDNPELQSKQTELEKQIQEFFDGTKEEYYLKVALAYLNPAIRDNLTPDISPYQFAETVTGLSWDNIQDKQAIINKYNEWKNLSDKRQQMKLLVDTMDTFGPKFSPKFKKYAERYSDIRKVVVDSILSEINFSFTDTLNHNNYDTLKALSTATKNSGLKGATLEDVLNIKPESIVDPIINKIYQNNKQLFDALAQAGNIDTQNFLKNLANILTNEISEYPIEQWDSSRIDKLVKNFLAQIKEVLGGERPDIDLMLDAYITPEGIREDLSTQAIKQYIKSQNTLDNELVKRLRNSVITTATNQVVLNKFNNDLSDQLVQEFNEFIPEEEDPIDSLSLSASQIKKIKDIISNAISTGDSIQNIIEKVTQSVIESLSENSDPRIKELLENNSNLQSAISNYIKEFIQTNSNFEDVRFLEEVNKKEIISNPLYDLLRNLSFQLSPDVKTTIFDLLQNESNTLSGLYDISEYIKMPDLMEQIRNAKAILKIAKALVAGMEDSALTPGHLFGYNSQIKKFLTSFKNGEHAENYETLETKDVYQIGNDLDLLIQKLEFIEKLSGMNTESQKEEDEKTRTQFNQIIINKLKENASKLQVNGVSIATPDDLAALENDTFPVHVRVGRFQHNMYLKFKSIIDSGIAVESAITTLFDNLHLDINQICKTSLDSAKLNKDIQSITDYDWAIWIATTLGSDANDYYYKYKKYLQENQENELVPLYIQELNTHIAYSMLSDQLGIHDAIQKYIISRGGGYPANTKNIIFTDGVSGSGKTTAIAKLLLEFIPEQNIFVAAPNNDSISHSGQANKLKDSLGLSISDDKVLNKEQLLKHFITDEAYSRLALDSTKDTFDSNAMIQKKSVGDSTYKCLSDNINDSIFKENIETPKLIFIDETTHFNTAELQILDMAAEKFGFKIIALGDTYQESANIGSEEAHIDQVFVWKGPRLGISSRPANVNKKDNIDRFQVALDSYYNELRKTGRLTSASQKLDNYLESTGLIIKYYEDQNSLSGDKIVDEISVEDLNKIKSLSNGEKILIITKLTDSGEIENQNFKAILQSSGLTENDYELRSPDKIHPKATQGAESKYTIIDYSGLDNQNNIDSIKKLYTIFTRSQEGSLIKLPVDIQNKLHISNSLTSKPSIYKLPGSTQTSELKQGRIDDITNIIGSYTPTGVFQAPGAANSNPAPTSKSNNIIPENQFGSFTPEQPEQSATDLLCYGFYTHTGLKKDSDRYISGNRNIPLDLEGLPNLEFTTNAVQGFLKLKNLITLYQDTSSPQFISGLRNSKFTAQIAQFVRELNPNLKLYSDEDVLNWIKEHIKIDQTPYIVGVKMDQGLDRPIFKFGFDESALVTNGQPLLLMARKVTIEDQNFKFDRYISTGSLPKSVTMERAKNDFVRNTLRRMVADLESKTAEKLKTKEIVIYKSAEQFRKLGNADGRFVHKKENEKIFDSLQDLENGGVNIKEVVLVTSDQTSDGKYRFIEWAKKFNPEIERIAFSDRGEYTLAGRYIVRVSYTNSIDNSEQGSPSITDHVLEVELKTISALEAVSQLKSITGNLQEKRQILHAESYSKLITSILTQLNAFGINPAVSIQKILTEFKAQLAKNPEMHSSKIASIDNFMNNNKVIDQQNIQRLFQENNDITILLTDWLIKDASNSEIKTRYNINVGVPNIELHQNVSPSEQADVRGCCKLVNGYMSKLGLTSGHYEPPLFGLSANGLNSLQDISETNQTPTQQSSTPPPVQPQSSNTNSNGSAQENIEKFLASKGYQIIPGSRDAKIIDLLNMSPDVLANNDIEDIIEVTEDGLVISSAVEDQFDQNLLDDLNNEQDSCAQIN